MMDKYEREIINKLIDKYEKSKSFIGENKVEQRFSIKVTSLFSKYGDHSNYEVFQGVNEAIHNLTRKSFVLAKENAAHVYNNVVLNKNALDEIYEYVNRVPKKDMNKSLLYLIENYKGRNDVLSKYCAAQYERINANKSTQFFNGDLTELENILIAVDELLKVNKETFMRDFSVRVFNDSKLFEGISTKVINLLYEYGDFPEKEQVLGNLNIVKNPTYINFKGAGRVTIKGQEINLTGLDGDIAISSIILSDIEKIQVVGKAVITIENLTSFHTFEDKDIFAIYLGGYHNSLRREFIKKMYEQNPNIDYFHFGDIDAGGFYILEHLKRQTGVKFKAFKMDTETLMEYRKYTKPLTENDGKRLSKLIDSEYHDVVEYMLNNNCKLEQEAIDIKRIKILTKRQ